MTVRDQSSDIVISPAQTLTSGGTVSSAIVYHKHPSASEIVCSTNFGIHGGMTDSKNMQG